MRVLFVPALGPGMGSGHLRRTAELARRLGPQAAVLLEGRRQGTAGGPRELLRSLGLDGEGIRCVETYPPAARRDGLPAAAGEGPWELVVVDRRATSRAELARFGDVPVVGFDEGGEARRYVAYLVDLLPQPPGFSVPNRSVPGLLFLPSRSPAAAGEGSAPVRAAVGPGGTPPRRILLSFGGEDPADLTARLLALLIGRLRVPAERVTVVQGGLFRRSQWPEGVEVLRSPKRLADLLGRYDLVFTSFGLTTFECLAAGVPVVNLNPSRYHRRLSRAAGIPEVGVRRARSAAVRRALRDPAWRTPRRAYPAEGFRPVEDLTGFFEGLRPDAPGRCPVCGRADNPAVARFPERSYFACRGCGVTYLLGFGLQSRSYERGYFEEEYRSQYGRTYLEDFDAIKAVGRRRASIVRRLLGTEGGRLLDVGCAYGPFLAAARETGFEGEGVDVSAAAVGHVREVLGLPCQLGDFEAGKGLAWAAGSFDAVSMWYVLEHFRDPARALERAVSLLRPGGVLALATPNGAGISGRWDRERFLRSSPTDHRTVWDPRTARRVLRRHGLRPALTVITGHHPERFPWPGGVPVGEASGARRVLIGLVKASSRLFGLGDTFELYAVRGEGRR
ncbi:MAG: methyltransferase domain-containing protein [Spirochaetales bacterium]|nr:methyltransferase domain-containing protein [Spirochaetales bacterium]